MNFFFYEGNWLTCLLLYLFKIQNQCEEKCRKFKQNVHVPVCMPTYFLWSTNEFSVVK